MTFRHTLIIAAAVMAAAIFLLTRGGDTGEAAAAEAPEHKPEVAQATAPVPIPQPAEEPEAVEEAVAVTQEGDALQPLPEPPRSPFPVESAEHREWLFEEIAKTEKLVWEDDPESMRTILSQLNSPYPEMRSAGLYSAKAFGDRAAIPYLERIRQTTKSGVEQAAITEAIEYLKLESFTEYLQRTQGAPKLNRTP